METDRLVRKAGKTFTTWRPWLSIKASANLAGLLALPCRIAEFSCVPPHNEEEKTADPDELSTTNTKLLNNYFWQMVIYIYIYIHIYIYIGIISYPHSGLVNLGYIPTIFGSHLGSSPWCFASSQYAIPIGSPDMDGINKPQIGALNES